MSNNRAYINLLTTLVVIAVFFLLISGSFNMPLWLRLLCAIYLGVILGIVWLPLIHLQLTKLDDKIKIIEWISLGFGIIAFIIALSPLDNFHYSKWLDNVFDKQISYNVADFFNNNNEIHYIFGFDKTEYNKDDNKSPYIDQNEDLITLYNKYTSTKNNQGIRYREFCKAKISYDLQNLHKVGVMGTFSIYTIGEKSERLFYGNLSNKEDVINAIEKLKSVEYDAVETDIRHYLETIHSIVQDKEKPMMNQFHKYITFTYSDFILDRNGKSILSDINYIRILSQEDFPNLNIINNLFISPCYKIDNSKECCVIDYFTDNLFTKTKLEELTIKSEFGNSINNRCEKDTICYFFEKDDVSPRFKVNNGAQYSIRIDKPSNLNNKITLTNIENPTKMYLLSSTKPQEIKEKGVYSMRFANSNVPAQIVLDIAHQNNHCLLTLNIEKNKYSKGFVRFVFLFLLAFFSIGIPYSLHEIYNNVKNRDII